MYFVFLCFYKNEIKITNKKKDHLSNTCQTLFYFNSKALFVLKKMKF